jgi:hypothetical protein
LNSQIKFKVQGSKEKIIEEGSDISIDYLNIGNPKMEIKIYTNYTNQDKKEKSKYSYSFPIPKYSFPIPKDSYRWIKIQFDKEEIVGFTENVNPVVIGQLYGSALKLEEEGKPFRIVRVYITKGGKASWERLWEGSDDIELIGVEGKKINKTAGTTTAQRKSRPTARSKAVEEKKNKKRKSTPTATMESEDTDRIAQKAKPQKVQGQGPKTEQVLQQQQQSLPIQESKVKEEQVK